MVEETTCSFDANSAFGVTNAHYIILGCSLFSIFWGVCNAILVSLNFTIFNGVEFSLG